MVLRFFMSFIYLVSARRKSILYRFYRPIVGSCFKSPNDTLDSSVQHSTVIPLGRNHIKRALASKIENYI